VIADGPRLIVWINGTKVSDLIDAGIHATHPRGFIGLQVHSIAGEGPYEVAWRDLRLQERTAGSGAEGRVDLFNGEGLGGWTADVPEADGKPDIAPSFGVEDGLLISNGNPQGHLLTDESFADYLLHVEYRFPEAAGNCGVLVHASTPRALYGMFPASIEVQMYSGNAGDFWCIQESIQVPDMETRRPLKEGQEWGGAEGDSRRILNLTDDSEHALGEWNTMIVVCRGREIQVWVNGDLVNHGFGCTKDRGKIALQAEGTKVEFRRVQLQPLGGSSAK
jgi:hypothetical protein